MLSKYHDKQGMPESSSNTDAETKDDNLKGLPYPHSDSMLTFRKPLIVCADIVGFAVSLMLSFLVAYNMQFRRSWLVEQYLLLVVFFIVIKLIVFASFKLYGGWWRYVGVSDLIGILGASFVSTLIIRFLWFIVALNIVWVRRNFPNVAAVSQSVFVADFFATVLILGGLRIIRRIMNFWRLTDE
jgi:FlaA1/EpsC-like NDP-sugar epimerase